MENTGYLKYNAELVFPVAEGFTVNVKINEPAYLFSNQYSVRGRHYHIFVKLQDCSPLDFSVTANMQHIEDVTISMCEGLSGSIILKKLKQFAESIGVKRIRFLDASYIPITRCGADVKFSLKTLYLLTEGKTWYHSQGYTADFNDTSIELMLNQITIPMNEFIQKLEKALVSLENFEYIRQKCITDEDGTVVEHTCLNELLSVLNVSHLDFGEVTVQQYFKVLSIMLKGQETDCTTIIKICELIDLIDQSAVLMAPEAILKLLDIPSETVEKMAVASVPSETVEKMAVASVPRTKKERFKILGQTPAGGKRTRKSRRNRTKKKYKKKTKTRRR
jgi:hypothetical protein